MISYLFDPDEVFGTNLRRSGVRNIICAGSNIQPGTHATRQLAEPLKQLGIEVKDYAPQLFPSTEDRHGAHAFLDGSRRPVFALHIGSGSVRKNWPIDRWIGLGNRLLGENGGSQTSLVVVAGEADEMQRRILETEWRNRGVKFAVNLPLPLLAAILEECFFIGHDSGISQLAAAVGAKCLILFGPTDPVVWAPQGQHVRLIRAPNDNLQQLPVEAVFDPVATWEWPGVGAI